ncbi:hypothetical protein CL622_01785 [archaeon]|nr:hypothetical protein [archaeon]
MKGYIINTIYETKDDEVTVKLFGRLSNGKSFLATKKSKPYFYILKKDQAKAKKLEEIIDIEKSLFKDFDGKPVVKLYTKIPSDVAAARHTLKQDGVKTYEADIRFTQRFLIDNGLKQAVEITGPSKKGKRVDLIFSEPKIKPVEFSPKPIILSIDIETNRFAKKIFSIALYMDGYEKVFCSKKFIHKDAICFENEKKMLQAFRKEVIKLDPDIITGWSVIDFDLKVLRDRCDEHKLSMDLGRVKGQTKLNISPSFFRESSAQIKGRMVLDGLHLLRVSFINLPNYKLETAATQILGKHKLIDFKNKEFEIETMFRKADPKLLSYNLLDAKLVCDILEKSQALKLALTRADITGLPLDRVDGSIAALDSLYLRALKPKKIVAPTSNYAERENRITGGFVMDSKPGIYDYVLVLDFKSLYPSLMMTFNIDPLGYVGKKKGTLKKQDFVRAPNGAVFKNQEGILPDIVDRILKQREVARKNKNELERYSLKILMASFFGILANPMCRFYSFDMANAITHFGQYYIKEVARLLKEKGYEVIYMDTDSIFLDAKESSLHQSENLGKKLAKTIDLYLDKKIKKDYHRKSRLELEFEKVYIKFLMPQVRGSTAGAKKRYAGLLKKGRKEEIEFVGLESVRRDWTGLAKTFQRKLFDRIFHEKEVASYIKSFVKDVKSGKHDELLVYTKAIRKKVSEYVKTTPPHVKAARKAGITNPGLIEYVITTDGPEVVDKREHPIDYEHYIVKQLKPIADSILIFYNQEFNDIIKDGKQVSLFDFKKD